MRQVCVYEAPFLKTRVRIASSAKSPGYLCAQALQDLYGVPRKLVRTDDRTRRAKEKAAAKAKALVVREKKAEKAKR